MIDYLKRPHYNREDRTRSNRYIGRDICFFIQGGLIMGRLVTLVSAIVLALAIVPGQILAAGGGGAEEAAHAEPSGLLLTSLIIMSILTLVVMIFFSFRDNG